MKNFCFVLFILRMAISLLLWMLHFVVLFIGQFPHGKTHCFVLYDLNKSSSFGSNNLPTSYCHTTYLWKKIHRKTHITKQHYMKTMEILFCIMSHILASNCIDNNEGFISWHSWCPYFFLFPLLFGSKWKIVERTKRID